MLLTSVPLWTLFTFVATMLYHVTSRSHGGENAVILIIKLVSGLKVFYCLLGSLRHQMERNIGSLNT